MIDKKDSTVIISFSRTPIGSFLGSLSTFPAPRLGAFVIKELLKKSKLDSNKVDEVIMGNVLQAGIGQAPARQAAIFGDLSEKVQCLTINKVCGSGLKSIMLSDMELAKEESNVIIAGGMENMSQVPHYIKNLRKGKKLGPDTLIDGMVHDGLWDPYNNLHMGNCAESLNTNWKISRKEQDEFAVESYRRSLKAIDEGKFKDEIVPINLTGKRDSKQLIENDEEPFKGRLEKFSTLKPAFSKDGSITAANASSINDGAAGVLLMKHSYAQKNNLNPMFKILSHVSYATHPIDFTIAPIAAIEKVCKKTDLNIDDIDLFEINEAFSCVPLAVIKKLKLDLSKINIYGGAVSLGHPIGASGARILVTLMNAMLNNNVKYGLAAICIGGGEASAIIIENMRIK